MQVNGFLTKMFLFKLSLKNVNNLSIYLSHDKFFEITNVNMLIVNLLVFIKRNDI